MSQLRRQSAGKYLYVELIMVNDISQVRSISCFTSHAHDQCTLTHISNNIIIKIYPYHFASSNVSKQSTIIKSY